MAFFSKAGNILRQTVSKHINSEISGSNPSVFQMIRCMSSSKVFVGGLSYNTDDTSLREAFDKYGEVIEARVIIDRDSGRSRGFGFITYTSGEEASSAIQALDGQELHGRTVRVNYANDRAPRTGGYGGGGYGGGGGGNYAQGGTNYDSGSSGNYGGGNQSFGGGSGGSYGGGNYSQGGTYASGTNYDSGSSGNYGGGNQSFGIASGDAGLNVSSASDGFDGSTGLGLGGDQFGSNESGNVATASGGFVPDDSVVGNYRDDDDEPDDYANKRA
ncbi:unnamed protein product [Camellia sinensis]